jgi:hypothetical protein
VLLNHTHLSAERCPLHNRREYEWHVFVPLVSALVPTLSPHNKVVHITPPDGLLELGERPHLIAWLKQQLQPYLSALSPGGTSGARCVAPAPRFMRGSPLDADDVVCATGRSACQNAPSSSAKAALI